MVRTSMTTSPRDSLKALVTGIPSGSRRSVFLADQSRPRRMDCATVFSARHTPGALTVSGSLIASGDALVGSPPALVASPPAGVHVEQYRRGRALMPPGSMLVRVDDHRALSDFIADADTALESGVFPHRLTGSMTLLADADSLGDGRAQHDGPTVRIWCSNGEVRVSPRGPVIGAVDQDPTEWEESWRHVIRRRPPEVVARPWLDQYHLAISAIRRLNARNLGPVRVSGFGWRLVSDAHAFGSSRNFVLAATPHSYFVVSDVRMVRVTREGAEHAEMLSTERVP